MITKINAILLLNVLTVNCFNPQNFNKTVVNSFANSSETKISKIHELRDQESILDVTKGDGNRETKDLNVIQKYLITMGKPDYNDEIIATYLSCSGMLSASNQCLERLTCQFSDTTSPMKQLEKEVSSLVIYSLLKNQEIDKGFKNRLQRAAFFGKDNPGKCNLYNCPKTNKNKKRKR